MNDEFDLDELSQKSSQLFLSVNNQEKNIRRKEEEHIVVYDWEEPEGVTNLHNFKLRKKQLRVKINIINGDDVNVLK